MRDDDVELRGMCPRRVVDVLDAVSNARRITRTELVNAVLSEWADARIHESSLIHRIVGLNPSLRDEFGAGAERLARK
jgi:hypothetical protein